MATWSPLRQRLASVDDRLTLAWAELDTLVGSLPPSAYHYAAFWSGDRTGWRGFRTENVTVGRSVTFVRCGAVSSTTRLAQPSAPAPSPHGRAPVDVVLVGCVKEKLDRPAPAQDLYTSALFRKARAYAEANGARWFVLSAKHGLVEPSTVLEPYDLRLSETSRDYRRAWGSRVVDEFLNEAGPVAGRVIEIHAGAVYADAVRDRLAAGGATVAEPLRGLRMGERLAWYGQPRHTDRPGPATPPTPDVGRLVERLGSADTAISPADFLASRGAGLRQPGLYSWWVDPRGATDLAAGLGEHLDAGLIYGGLAGATRSRSGRRSQNTLWGRIRSMHLGGRAEFSTFRLSLGSILANASGATEIDEESLTAWMHEHLRLVTVAVPDADALDRLETYVLAALNPPLNLSKMPTSPIRDHLTALRRQYSERTPSWPGRRDRTRSPRTSPGRPGKALEA